ncbi:MAG: phosphotransferase [Rhodospirillales bacterium]|nr:MAG: phosphotransferase [Rhodospirillales bacterium]
MAHAAATLARFHRLDWRRVLPDWEGPTPLSVELRRWDKVLRHAQDAGWLEIGLRVQAALLATEPEPRAIGLVHGDFQPGNLLYGDAGQLHGVIDWELASIGAQGLDLGWLMMMGDRGAWAPEWAPVTALPPATLLEAYRAAGGPVAEHVDWFQAFAAYRMASIACLNVKLHRTGRRPDPLWDRFAPAIPHLFRWAARRLENLPA